VSDETFYEERGGLLMKLLSDFPPSVQVLILIAALVLGYMLLSNHGFMDNVLNLFRNFPVVLFIPLRGKSSEKAPLKHEAPPLTM
jgi:hypothetical protein